MKGLQLDACPQCETIVLPNEVVHAGNVDVGNEQVDAQTAESTERPSGGHRRRDVETGVAQLWKLLHAELLASVVVCQTANPGAPMMLHPLAMTMDWQTGLGLSASIESTMMTAGSVQVANEVFNMPVDVHGPWSDTHIADSQSAIERTFQTLLPALCGAASIAGFGDVQQGMVFCPVQLGIDEELAGFTLKALESEWFRKQAENFGPFEKAEEKTIRDTAFKELNEVQKSYFSNAKVHWFGVKGKDIPVQLVHFLGSC